MIKLGLGIFLAMISLLMALLSIEVKAQMSSPNLTSKLGNNLSLVQPKLAAQDKHTEVEAEEEPLDFSSSGRSGQQTAGESRGNCPQMNFPLTAIAPKDNVSKTSASHPRWWFYLPYDTSQISKIEFVLQDEERKDLVRKSVVVTETLPYISTTIPRHDLGIKPDRWYRWYLKVYCLEEKDTVPLFVSGWVQRITLDSKDDLLSQETSLTPTDYAQQGLWLDAIDLLLKTQVSRASASKPSQAWQTIINSPHIDLELPLPKKTSIAIE
ncbi:conserved hypothetical protein [Hyella patelloides LEGE 07179]|uniref:DUF928 domain-containing protein n=1 Tax=Hyella patelloides LEGE 07179 TaxID=945734 RepID=A0A563VQ29_9CYAN|nr:DUF928 domain-containing protein [Hyella patelloides]VEP13367.1 conserved hypothetical protein [Hyella patelloides LEGE 07179]